MIPPWLVWMTYIVFIYEAPWICCCGIRVSYILLLVTHTDLSVWSSRVLSSPRSLWLRPARGSHRNWVVSLCRARFHFYPIFRSFYWIWGAQKKRLDHAQISSYSKLKSAKYYSRYWSSCDQSPFFIVKICKQEGESVKRISNCLACQEL